MARASTYTLLSLDRFARVMGVSPMAFNTGQTPSLATPIFPLSGCNEVWFQYDWQRHDQVGREQLAGAIAMIEEEIARLIGYYPAPTWITEEHTYTRPYRKTSFGTGRDTRNLMKSINTRFGRVIEPGVRAVEYIGEAEVVYDDLDGDGYSEVATVAFDSDYDDCELKVYFTDKSGAQEWEIRPAKSTIRVGATLTLKFDSWMFILPELWEAYPNVDGLEAIDISTTSNFVETVEIYREYSDTTVAPVTFYWDHDHASCGQDVCSVPEMSGCFTIKDAKNGIIVPYPASYNEDTQSWVSEPWTHGCEPQRMTISYRAGERSKRYLDGIDCDPLSDFFAQIISWVAIPRLERPICACGNLQALSEYLREDLAQLKSGSSYFNTREVLGSVLGTRRGEVFAWRRLTKLVEKKINVAVI
jgi:hypothetical protein